MSCCNTYEKLGCFGSCEPVSTGILAPSQDSYKMYLEFNFGITEYEYLLDEGDEFVIPCPFNEFYIYTFQIYDSSGSLLNDTCYRFQTRMIKSDSVSNSCGGNTGNRCIAALPIIIAEAGSTITATTLNDYTAYTISVGGTTYVDGWTQTGDTITFTNGVVFGGGEVIKIIATKN